MKWTNSFKDTNYQNSLKKKSVNSITKKYIKEVKFVVKKFPKKKTPGLDGGEEGLPVTNGIWCDSILIKLLLSEYLSLT